MPSLVLVDLIYTILYTENCGYTLRAGAKALVLFFVLSIKMKKEIVKSDHPFQSPFCSGLFIYCGIPIAAAAFNS